jgi:streptogramin lyase
MRALDALLCLGTASLLSVAAWATDRGAPVPAPAPAPSAAAADDPGPPRNSAEWLARLPDGETKRRFLLDCTGCHLFDERIALADEMPRPRAQWEEAVERMLRYAGANSSFPVISADREPEATAEWLTASLRRPPKKYAPPTSGWVKLEPGRGRITEFLLPDPRDLPHDIAIDRTGAVLVTGMFTDRIYQLDPASGIIGNVRIPIPQANPRAIELDAKGDWWVVLGTPHKVARYSPRSGKWRSFDVGMYAHSLAQAQNGKVWFNGHFTRWPELIGRIDPVQGRVTTEEVPPHATLAEQPGGPIPYEIRVAPDGRVWGSELAGNRLFCYAPRSETFLTYDLPTPHSGPRRFDIDANGVLWIPAYAANLLVRFDPVSARFEEIPLPVRNAAPYVVRVDRRNGRIWIGTAAADLVLAYDAGTRTFQSYPLPSRGALVRHLAIDPRSHDVWVAYGASPGIAARVARIAL